jgi:AcrR family transcriptional regulator
MRSATNLLRKRSAAAVTVNDIAVAARVSKASLYKEFPNKEALVEAVVAARSDDVHRQIVEAAQRRKPGIERITSLCQELSAWHASPGFTGCLVVNTAISQQRADETHRIAQDHIQRYHDFISSELAHVTGIKAPDEVAGIIVALIEGVTLLAALRSPAAPELCQTVLKVIDTSNV